MNNRRRRIAKRQRQAARRLENFMAARHMDRDERTNVQLIADRFDYFFKAAASVQAIARHVKTIRHGQRFGMGTQKLAQHLGANA